MRHLSQVASNARKNKMDSKNLAAVFGLLVFGGDETPGDVALKLRSKVRYFPALSFFCVQGRRTQ